MSNAEEHRRLVEEGIRQADKHARHANRNAAVHAFQLGQLNNQAKQQTMAQDQLVELQRAQNALAEQQALEMRNARFAHWRQTPDGQAYSRWLTLAESMVATAETRSHAWDNATAAAVERRISDEDREEFKSDVYLPKTTRQKYADALGILALVSIPVAVLLWIVTPVVGFFGALIIIVVFFAIAFFSIDNKWTKANAAVKEEKAQARKDEFGFDPLADPTGAPQDWSADGRGRRAAEELEAYRQVAMVQLPDPSTLPGFPSLAVIDQSQTVLAEHKQLLGTVLFFAGSSGS